MKFKKEKYKIPKGNLSNYAAEALPTLIHL